MEYYVLLYFRKSCGILRFTVLQKVVWNIMFYCLSEGHVEYYVLLYFRRSCGILRFTVLHKFIWNITFYCIIEGHAGLINKWRKEDELFYDKTQGFTATLKMVKAKRYITIIGGPGSGKTVTYRHIVLQLEEQGWEVMPVCELKDIIEY